MSESRHLEGLVRKGIGGFYTVASVAYPINTILCRRQQIYSKAMPPGVYSCVFPH